MTKLFDFIPPPFLRRNLERGVASALGRPFDRWRGVASTRIRYVDAEGAPMEFVTWLLGVLGFEGLHIQGLSDRRRRNLVGRAMEIWRSKWNEAGIASFLEALAGVSSEFEAVNVSAFVAGVSSAGEVCGPGVNAYRFELHHDGEMDESDMRRLLRLVVPAFSEYRLCTDTGCGPWESP